MQEDAYFNTCLKYRWNELRNKTFNNDSIFDFIDANADLLDKAQQRNYQKFYILNSYVWPNSYIGGSYFNEVNHLKLWIADRLDWLDSRMDLIIPVSVNESLAGFSAATNQVIVYPNPVVSDKVTFRVNIADNAEVEIVIRNVLGKVISVKKQFCFFGVNEIVFSMNDFIDKNQLYIYCIVVNGETIQSGKVSKL